MPPVAARCNGLVQPPGARMILARAQAQRAVPTTTSPRPGVCERGSRVAGDGKAGTLLRAVRSEGAEHRHRARVGGCVQGLQVLLLGVAAHEEVEDRAVVPDVACTRRAPGENVGDNPFHVVGAGAEADLGVFEPGNGDVEHDEIGEAPVEQAVDQRRRAAHL
jgi:hypothetical protein